MVAVVHPAVQRVDHHQRPTLQAAELGGAHLQAIHAAPAGALRLELLAAARFTAGVATAVESPPGASKSWPFASNWS